MRTAGHFMNKICKFYVYMYVSFYGDFQVSEGNIDPTQPAIALKAIPCF